MGTNRSLSLERFWHCAAWATTVWLLGCSGATDPDPVTRQRRPIVGGTAESGADWVVAVTYPRPSTGNLRLCSGSLIAPDRVLTAKHCVHDEVSNGVWEPVDPSQFTVWVGTDVTDPTTISETTGVAAFDTTPGVYTRADALGGQDIAVLTLTSPLSPLPISLSHSAPSVGLEVFIAGYGDTLSKLGRKHSGFANISTLDTGTFVTTGSTWTCVGDSGGPAMDSTLGDLVGVTSIGPTGCDVSDSIYTRLDAHLDWIEPAVPCDQAGCGGAGGTGGAGTGGAAGSGPAPVHAGSSGDEGSCSLARPTRGDSGWLAIALAFALGLAARRRKAG